MSFRPGPGLVLLALLGCLLLGGPPAQAASKARLAFEHDGSIWTMAADGSDRVRVTRGQSAHGPRWSPRGDRIAYTVYEPKDRTSVWTVAPDGSDRRRVVPAGAMSYGGPAWSPDGSKLALAGVRLTDTSFTSSIVVTDAAGGGARTVTRLRTTETLDAVGAPVWLPDGRRLAYTRSGLDAKSYFTAEIRTVGEDGAGDTIFLRNAQGGAWSPDGTRFAYGDIAEHHGESCGSDECSYNSELAVVDAAGAGRRLLTHTLADESDPAWSADGQRLAFSSGRNGPKLAFDEPEVYSVDTDGSCLTWLTNGSPASTGPSWAPGSEDTSPGACGAAGRAPMVEVAPGTSRRRPLWLGPTFGTALLANTQDSVLDYEDCGEFEPSACLPAFLLNEESACVHGKWALEKLRYDARALRHAREAGGVLVGQEREGTGGLLLAASTIVFVQVDSRSTAAQRAALYLRVARALRRTPSVARTPVGRPRLAAAAQRLLPERLRRLVRPC